MGVYTQRIPPGDAAYSRDIGPLGHRHRDCGSKERLWLPKENDAAATAARHPFCTQCGTVRNLGLPRAKPLGYYLRGIALLKEYLDYSALHTKLVQVQSHLMTQRLEAQRAFEDPYGTPGEAQLRAYVNIVQSIRPDLDEELIIRLLPKGRRQRSSKGRDQGVP